ncbi:MAG: acetolactate synthase small subunit [Alphaproteobacteria bacterium]
MTNKKKPIHDDAPPASAYEISEEKTKRRFHTLAVVVDNEAGVLARVVGLFSGRGYNIKSLTVSPVSQHNYLSRITLVTLGNEKTIRQIKAQLERLVPVHEVHDLTTDGNFMSVEIILIKLLLEGTEDKRKKIIAQIEKKGAMVIKNMARGMIIEYSGHVADTEQFIKWAYDLGKIELVRSGVVAISTDMKPSHFMKSDD